MLSIEEVEGKGAFRRFVELPFALFGSEPRWAPPVMAYERARLDGRRNPRLAGDARYLMARRNGRIVGRLLVHGDGRFGCFDGADREVAEALLDAAPEARYGPVSFGDEVDGVLVAGFDVAGVTGRQWHPPWLAAALEAGGFERGEERRMWRLPAHGLGAGLERGGAPPMVAGPYADPRLVFEAVAAAPDLAPALRELGPRAAWSLARRVRRAEWEGCTIVRLDGDGAEVVSGLVAAAGAAGYRWVVAPWAPDDGPPETVHVVHRRG